MWFTGINGKWCAQATTFAAVTPTSKEPTKPGP